MMLCCQFQNSQHWKDNVHRLVRHLPFRAKETKTWRNFIFSPLLSRIGGGSRTQVQSRLPGPAALCLWLRIRHSSLGL